MSYIIYPIVVFYFISHPSQFFMYWIYFLFYFFFFVLNFSYFTRKENKMCGKLCLRVRLFWMKMISGNHFHPFLHVWLQWKIQFSGNCIPVDQNLRLWPGNEFTLPFSLQFISGKRERERERERKEKREPRSEREWEKRELRSESTDRRSRRSSDDRTAPTSGTIDGIARCDRPDSEIARCDRWDCIARWRGFWFDEIASLVGAGFGLMRSHRSSSLVVRTIASLRSELSLLSWSMIHFLLLGFGFVDDFFLGCGLCSGFVFSFFFSKHQKIFSGKFFEIQPNNMETFSFSGN